MGEMNTIITIGRQFGSGGHEVGTRLAAHYGIRFYDKEMLNRAAKESGICKELFESHDEKPTSSFLYSLVMDTYSFGLTSSAYAEMPLNQKVFLAQFDAIKKIAEEGPCILVGRCADYALEDRTDCVNIFIHADMDARIRRVARMYDLSDAAARDKIIKTDKKRASYYNYYTNKRWSDASSYDLSISSSRLGIEKTVEEIIRYVETFESVKERTI